MRLFFIFIIAACFLMPANAGESGTGHDNIDGVELPLPLKKKLTGLVVLIDFEDSPAWLTTDRVNNFMNKKNYREGSINRTVREYWLEQSRGEIDIKHVVVGYFRAPKQLAWYKEQDWKAGVKLFGQALDWIVETNPGFDWNSLSLAKGEMATQKGEEGSFLSINFIPSAGFPGSGATHHLNWTAPNGIKTRQIVGITVTRRKEEGVNLFGFNHELGHSVFGIPDTYDNDGSSHGTGVFSVMGGNRPDVEPLGGPFIAQKGWVKVVEIEKSGKFEIEEDGDVVIKFTNQNKPEEYFLVEARNQATIGNSSLPSPRGLIIWHMDNSVKTANRKEQMTTEEHYRTSIEQADGKFDLEKKVNRGDNGDMFKPGDDFNDSTIPNSKWWDGSSSGINLKNIQFLENGKISFEIEVGY